MDREQLAESLMRHGFNRHPLSEAWGNMSEEALLELAEDIKQNGQKDAVVMYEGMVLDGWHRCQGCQIADIDVRTKEYRGDDPVSYVISKNAHRRSQTASQRAAAVVRCHEWYQSGENQHTRRGGAPGAPPPASNEQMAKEANTSVRTVQQAKVAQEAGLGDAVVDGKISAKQAEKEASRREDKPKQPTALDKAKAQIAELKSEIADRDEKIREVTDHLQSYLDAGGSENDQKVKFAQLREQIRVLESQLNEHKIIANKFKRECTALRKELKTA